MESIDIAFYTDSYFPAVDGVVTSIMNFKKGLEKRGHKVYIFASVDPDVKGKYSKEDVFLYDGIEFKPYPQYSVAFFPYNAVLKGLEVKPDLIHAHTPFFMGFAGLVASKLGKAPLVGSFHTMINDKALINDYYPKNKALKEFTAKYIWGYTKFFYRRCNMTITPSNRIGSMLRKYKVPNVKTVPNSIDLSVFNARVKKGSFREDLKIREDESMILYLGRISREKKLETMIRAAAKLSKKKNIKFVIGGSGPALVYYQNMVKRLNVEKEVKFIGFVDQKKLPSLYASADAVCMPSTFETQGIVALEAMAVGRPVVGADSMALSDIIKNGINGEKFQAGDYIGCAQKIEKVLNNSERYKIGTINTASEFSIENITDRLLDAYRLVLAKQAIN